jgi:hypothetical protein
MNRFITVFGLSLLSLPTMAQVTYKKADSLYNEGEIKEAILEYKKAYQIDSSDYNNVYNMSCAFAQDRQIDSAFKYLYITTRLNSVDAPLSDPDFLPLKGDKRWLEFENQLVATIQQKYQNPITNEAYARKLWELHALDQAYYKDINLAERALGRNSSVVWALWELKKSINEQNQKELELLINKNGWPKISQVGRGAASSAFLIIQHSNLAKQKKYLPIIQKLCAEKEADWQSYALMYDRVQVGEKKPQRYGSQVTFNKTTQLYELEPLEDEQKVDEWRSEIGMQPLANYLMHWNIKWTAKTK